MVTRAPNYWIEVKNSIISTVATLLVVQMKMKVRPPHGLKQRVGKHNIVSSYVMVGGTTT